MTVNLNTIPRDAVIEIAKHLDNTSLLKLPFVAKAFADVVVDVYKKDNIVKNQLLISRINKIDVNDEKKIQDLCKIFAKGLTIDQLTIRQLDYMYGLSNRLKQFLRPTASHDILDEALIENPLKRRRLI